MTNWLVISWMFAASWLPIQDWGMYPAEKNPAYSAERYVNATKIEFDVNACLWNRWDIYGGIKNYQSFNGFHTEGISFMPYSVDYTVGTELFLFPKDSKNINVSIYAKHECQHPVTVGGYDTKSNFNQAYTDIGVRVHGKVSF